jgi:hypothetical protein
MKMLFSIVLLSSLAHAAQAEERVVYSSNAPREVAGAVLELRSYDPAARTIVVVGESGREQVLRLDDRTLDAVSRLTPGEKLLISYRFNRNAETEVILRGLPNGVVQVIQPVTAAVAPTRGGKVVVLAAEPEVGTLTIRTPTGDVRKLGVDPSLREALEDLHAGDHILVDMNGGDLVGIVHAP